MNTKPSRASAPLLTIRGLKIEGHIADQRDGRWLPIIKGLDLHLARGEILGLIGESGAGKSTAGLAAMAFARPGCRITAGTIHFDGMPLHAQNEETLRKLHGAHIAYVAQSAAAARIRELLTLIELEPAEFIDRHPSELSGGQKQRISIARALAAEPDFIICDEVTSALDQLVAEGILKLLDRLQQEFKLAYLLITHDLATVRAIADRVIVMLQGAIVEQGETNAMFTPPHHPYTELLLSSVPEMDPNWLTTRLKQRARQSTASTVAPALA